MLLQLGDAGQMASPMLACQWFVIISRNMWAGQGQVPDSWVAAVGLHMGGGAEAPKREEHDSWHLMQVAGCAVSSDMVGDAEARERAARQALATKEERLRKLRPEAELQRLAAQLRDFQSRTYDLRQACAADELLTSVGWCSGLG